MLSLIQDLGSLSIIKEIQKTVKTDIIYFADQKNYPYGVKSQAQLALIIKKTINLLEKKFTPGHYCSCIKYTKFDVKFTNKQNCRC